MRYLALDQALQTSGWAIFKDEELIAHGSFSISTKKDMGERLALIYDEIAYLYGEYEFEAIFFEDIQNQQSNLTYSRLAYVQAVIMLWCEFEGNMPYRILAPSHWRSVLGGGFGNRREEQKNHAIALVKELYGESVGSDEADAILIGRARYIEWSDNEGKAHPADN